MTTEPYFELLLENEGSKMEPILMNALRQADVFNTCYAYKSRVKPEHKLVEKVPRRRKDKPLYKLSDITDIIGIRLVTLFRVDMPIVFSKVLDTINHINGLNPNPFKINSIEEITVFYTTPNDDITFNIKEIVKNKNVGLIVKETFSKEGYSSIHIVARTCEKVAKMSADGDYYIPVEIQIRTVFEDAWGEIDHKYGYVIRTGKELGTAVASPDSVLRHLKVMKKFADACGEYADAIHIEATVPVGCSVDPVGIISIGPDEELRILFGELEIPQEDISQYFTAREKRVYAESEERKLKTRGFKSFLEAAELFRELAANYPENKISPSDRANYLFYYYVKMNEALCLMSANDKDRVTAALHIYNHLETLYPDFILVKMRLAQTYVKNKYYDLAVEKFAEVYGIVKSIKQDTIEFTDNLPKIDYEHILNRLPIVYGYALWRKSLTYDANSPTDMTLRLNCFVAAYNLAIDTKPTEPKYITDKYNNLLYYAIEILAICNKFQVDCPIIDLREKLEQHLTKLKEVYDFDTCEDVEILDTILRAYDFLEDKGGVLGIVGKIVSLCETALEKAPSDREIVLDCEKFAIELKQKYDC